jgi:general secretion pathway protein G
MTIMFCQPHALVKQKEDNLKTLVSLAIWLAIATPTFCQSTSAPKNQEEKEQQLRTALEQIRDAIDHYHGMADRGKFQVPVGSRNYPLDLETLVKGVVDDHGKTIKFLQKIPLDPMTGTTDWGLERAAGVVQVPEGGGIFDVYTKSEATASDGTKYQNW